MPGFILHHAAAKLYINSLPEKHILKLDNKSQNEFYVGNLAPDTVTDKIKTHFWNSGIIDDFMRYPDLDLFTKKYSYLMKEPIVQGYFFHLYLDRAFLKEYIPSIVEFFDENGNIVEKNKDVKIVRVRRTGQELKVNEYLSDKYYYGDYTKMNTWLVKKYQLNLDLDWDCVNPGIEEVDLKNVRRILEQLAEYMNVTEEEADELKVFTKESLVGFLESVIFDCDIGTGFF